MLIREENRNMILLATVTLCSSAVAAVLAMVEPAPVRASDKLVAARAEIDVTAPTQIPVRVVGAPFEPNVNPRER
jgi:hypothetical protein